MSRIKYHPSFDAEALDRLEPGPRFEARTAAERSYVIASGRIVQDGITAADSVDDLAAAYLGSNKEHHRGGSGQPSTEHLSDPRPNLLSLSLK